jgi:hypothetical protein
VNESSSHRNTSQGNRFAANLGASGDVAPMITVRGSPPTPNTARYAWTVFRSGVLETWITGAVIATSTPPPLRGTASGSTSGTKSAVSAILPTTTQLLI